MNYLISWYQAAYKYSNYTRRIGEIGQYDLSVCVRPACRGRRAGSRCRTGDMVCVRVRECASDSYDGTAVFLFWDRTKYSRAIGNGLLVLDSERIAAHRTACRI